MSKEGKDGKEGPTSENNDSLTLRRSVFLGISGVVISIIGARVQYRRRNRVQAERDFLDNIPAPNTPEAYALGRTVAARAFAYGSLLCAAFGVVGVAAIRAYFKVNSVEEFGDKMKELVPSYTSPIREAIVEPIENSLTTFYENVTGQSANLHPKDAKEGPAIELTDDAFDKWWEAVKKGLTEETSKDTVEKEESDQTSQQTPSKPESANK